MRIKSDVDPNTCYNLEYIIFQIAAAAGLWHSLWVWVWIISGFCARLGGINYGKSIVGPWDQFSSAGKQSEYHQSSSRQEGSLFWNRLGSSHPIGGSANNLGNQPLITEPLQGGGHCPRSILCLKHRNPTWPFDPLGNPPVLKAFTACQCRPGPGRSQRPAITR